MLKKIDSFLRQCVGVAVVAVCVPFRVGFCIGAGQSGMVKQVVAVIVMIVVLGTLIPVLWPMMTDTSADIAALNGTDAGTGFMKTAWPIVLVIIGIGIAAGLIFFALRKFGVMGK